eukprot:TRINITY_DN2537_c1_g1_i7.p1 TRINITY_DN2537_c1_g1~~TRINITY_DN2537_c1_g1_i7.p1  ORF type:complete len:174 (+),score=28.50 TRINITY_DN2537_c1_g1_i7:57-524(+)
MFSATSKRLVSVATSSNVARAVSSGVVGVDFSQKSSSKVNDVVNEESPFGERISCLSILSNIEMRNGDLLNRTQDSIMGDHFVPTSHHAIDTLSDHLNYKTKDEMSLQSAVMNDSFYPAQASCLATHADTRTQTVSLSDALMSDYFFPEKACSLI